MLIVEEDVNFILHHFFVRVNYLVYSCENVFPVNVLTIIYILGMLSKSTACNFLGKKNDSCERKKICNRLRDAILRSFKEEN